MQNLSVEQGARQQDMMSKGRTFAFEAQEDRQQSQINRTAAQLTQQQNIGAQADSDSTAAITGMTGSLVSLGAGAV